MERIVVPYDPENAHTADKRPFVARVLAETGIDLKPDCERLSTRALEEGQRQEERLG